MSWILLMVLILLQSNARSLIANGQEFKKYVDNLGEKPNVMHLQEPWLKPLMDFIIKGYEAVRETGDLAKVEEQHSHRIKVIYV